MQQVYNLVAPTSSAVNVLAAASLRSAGFRGSGYIKSVEIDNPTGSWLLISTDNTFVAPYTIGFKHNLDYAATEISVNFVATGPAGQISTFLNVAGDKVRVVIYDDLVEASGGSDYNAFVTRQDQPEIQVIFITQTIAAGGTNAQSITGLLGGSLVKRLRVFDATIFSDTIVGVRPTNAYMGFLQEITQPGNVIKIPFLSGFLNPNILAANKNNAVGATDLSLGSEIAFTVTLLPYQVVADTATTWTATVNYAII
jgi:hypothetical protein